MDDVQINLQFVPDSAKKRVITQLISNLRDFQKEV